MCVCLFICVHVCVHLYLSVSVCTYMYLRVSADRLGRVRSARRMVLGAGRGQALSPGVWRDQAPICAKGGGPGAQPVRGPRHRLQEPHPLPLQTDSISQAQDALRQLSPGICVRDLCLGGRSWCQALGRSNLIRQLGSLPHGSPAPRALGSISDWLPLPAPTLTDTLLHPRRTPPPRPPHPGPCSFPYLLPWQQDPHGHLFPPSFLPPGSPGWWLRRGSRRSASGKSHPPLPGGTA